MFLEWRKYETIYIYGTHGQLFLSKSMGRDERFPKQGHPAENFAEVIMGQVSPAEKTRKPTER